MDFYNCDKKTIIKLWEEHYHGHIDNVLRFFKNKPGKLLHYKIDESNVNDLISFLPEFDFKLRKLYKMNFTKKKEFLD